MKCRCSNCGWLEINPSGAMFCGYSDERTWENESCLAWKDKDEQKTNGDSIRAMMDEELADWYFDKFFPCVPYCSMLQDGCPEHDDCKICLLEWLKRESEGE